MCQIGYTSFVMLPSHPCEHVKEAITAIYLDFAITYGRRCDGHGNYDTSGWLKKDVKLCFDLDIRSVAVII